jgi:hypothetical protein
MSLSIFGEKAIVPDDEMLASVLAGSKALWETAISHVEEACGGGDLGGEWKFYSKKAGWSFVVKSGKRTIIYLIPQEGFFKVNFVFGERAVGAAEDAGLPEPIVSLMLEAKQYMEGRSFMFDVKTEADICAVKKLVIIKYQN